MNTDTRRHTEGPQTHMLNTEARLKRLHTPGFLGRGNSLSCVERSTEVITLEQKGDSRKNEDGDHPWGEDRWLRGV